MEGTSLGSSSTHPILATVDVYLQRLETRQNTRKVDFSLSLSLSISHLCNREAPCCKAVRTQAPLSPGSPTHRASASPIWPRWLPVPSGLHTRKEHVKRLQREVTPTTSAESGWPETGPRDTLTPRKLGKGVPTLHSQEASEKEGPLSLWYRRGRERMATLSDPCPPRNPSLGHLSNQCPVREERQNGLRRGGQGSAPLGRSGGGSSCPFGPLPALSCSRCYSPLQPHLGLYGSFSC